MDQLLTSIVPLALFMLIPLWIPLLAIVGGAVLDRVRPVRLTGAAAAVEAAKERSVLARSQVRHDGAPVPATGGPGTPLAA